MKRLKYGLLAAAMVASSAAFIPASADAAEEGWVRTDKGTWYQYADGSYAKNEFIGSYWINSAGWVDDTTTYSWQKFAVTETNASIASARWQFGNTKWLAGLTKGKNQWWKIDGEWYYFHGDTGFMGQNEFVGKYYLTATGQWDPDVKGAWEKQSNGLWKFKKTTSDAEEYMTGWVTISGFEYHFGEDGILDTWKVIADDKYGIDDVEVYAFGANGHLGRYTMFGLDDEKEIAYDMTFKFSSQSEAKKGIASARDFLLGAYYKAGQKPADNKMFLSEINDTVRLVTVGLVEKITNIADSVTQNEDGTVTYTPASNKKTYTPNVCVTLTEDEFWYLLDHDYDGSWAVVEWDWFDGDEDIDWFDDGEDDFIAIPAIPINNYANYFINKDNYKEISVTLVDSLEDILYHWAGFAATSKFDCSVDLTATSLEEENKSVDVKISHLGMSSTYFIINVDGKNYQAYYEVAYDKDDDEYDIELYFLSNVSQTLGRKLYDAGIVDAYLVYNCLTEEIVSSVTDPDTGATYAIVPYALEDEVARRAATSTNE
jgi:hypothetical protein